MRKGQAGYVGGRYKSFQVRLSCADTVNKSQKHTCLQILATLSIYTDILSFDPQASEVVKPPFHPSCPKVAKQQEHPLMHMGPFHAEPRWGHQEGKKVKSKKKKAFCQLSVEPKAQ